MILKHDANIKYRPMRMILASNKDLSRRVDQLEAKMDAKFRCDEADGWCSKRSAN